jgi:hypothetical protein
MFASQPDHTDLNMLSICWTDLLENKVKIMAEETDTISYVASPKFRRRPVGGIVDLAPPEQGSYRM